jgi:flagellar basal-body rod protein FlgC
MPIDPARRLPMLPVPGQQTVRPMFKSLGIAASGLSAQRQRMEIIAQNIANADVTRGADGQPYKRKELVLEAANSQNALFNPDSVAGMGAGSAFNSVVGKRSNDTSAPIDGRKTVEVPVLDYQGGMGGAPAGPLSGQFGVAVVGVAEDQGEGHLVYEPGHPDADANGYVRYPDIDTTQETVKLLDAKRMYEANAAVFQTAKAMLRAALDI